MKRLLLLFSCLLTFQPALSQAESQTDTLLKDTAVIGTLLSWGAAALWGEAKPAHALHPGERFHLGTYQASETQLGLAGIHFGWDFTQPLMHFRHWQLRAHWEINLQGWWAERPSRHESGWIAGITPVVQYVYRSQFTPYVELGIGLKYLSDIQMGDTYKSTQFQFGDLVGFGMQLGHHLQIGFRFLHISNAGIETPNPGTNFYGIKMDYLF